MMLFFIFFIFSWLNIRMKKPEYRDWIFLLSLGTESAKFSSMHMHLLLQQERKVNLLEEDSSLDKVRNMRTLREFFLVLNQQFSTCIWTLWGQMTLSQKSLKTDIYTTIPNSSRITVMSTTQHDELCRSTRKVEKHRTKHKRTRKIICLRKMSYMLTIFHV